MSRFGKSLLSLFFGLSLSLSFCAQAPAVPLWGDELSITLDGTYVTKYMWYGYDLLDGDGAYQPSIDFAYKGFSAGVFGSWADESGHVDTTELDYYIGYTRTLFEEQPFALETSLKYAYYDYPKSDSVSGIDGVCDCQDYGIEFVMPNLIKLGPSALVPKYAAHYLTDGIQNHDDVDAGWFHILGLGYSVPLPKSILGQEEPALDLSWDLGYNGGAFDTDSAWSYTTLGVSTTLNFGKMYITPGINHQWSFEDTVNDENEWYGSCSVGYTF